MMLFLTSVLASPSYPLVLTESLDLPCSPPCTVCHVTLAGGTGTATQLFALDLIDAGATGGSDEDALLDALVGVDTTALEEGVDPNTDAPICDVDEPQYGCLEMGRGRSDSAWWGVALLSLVGLRRSAGSEGRAAPPSPEPTESVART